jgi:TonB family protein
MRPGIFMGLAVSVSLVAACQQPAADLSEQDRAALQQVIDNVASTLRAGDYVAWAELFAEDAVIYPPNAPAIGGREELLSWVATFPPIEDLAFFDVAIWGQGNYAYAMSGYTFSVEGSPPDTGKQLWVFHRTESSGWEVMVVGYSSDLPGAEQDALSKEPVETPFTERPEILDVLEARAVLEHFYPKELREAGIGGSVMLWVFIDVDGKVKNAVIRESSCSSALDSAATAATREFRVVPARNYGRVVPVWVSIPVTFASTK